MTCIVGFVGKEKVYIGGDSAGVAGFNYSIRADEKVFKKDEMIFGFTSSFRMGQILRYSFTIPDHHPKVDDYKYLCSTFIDALIDCFKSKGYATIDKNEVSGGTFLIGYHGNLYCVQSDFQVSKEVTPYDACGCGVYYAKGALYNLVESKGLKPKDIINKALETAEAFSAGVRGPFKIVSV